MTVGSNYTYREFSLVLCDDLEGSDGAVGGRLKREETYIYIYIHTHTHTADSHIADSFCCTAETNTVKQLYSN